MNLKSGITLISLVIVLFILLMLAGVILRATTIAYENAQVIGFVAKMNLIQEQVNIANIKKTNGDESISNLRKANNRKSERAGY